jgi:hypothetical protein
MAALIIVASMELLSVAIAQTPSHYLVVETPMLTPLAALSRVATGDVNRDGTSDFIVTLDQQVSTYLVGPGGVVAAPIVTSLASTMPAYANVQAPILADFNGDGNLDVLVFKYAAEQLTVLFGDGTGSFPTIMDLPSVNFTWANHRVADLNNDGFPEILVWQDTYPVLGCVLHVFTYSRPGATFYRVSMQAFSAGVAEYGDVDGDGFIDLVALRAGQTGIVNVYRGDGAFGFGLPLSIPIPLPTSLPPPTLQVLLADFDSDGRSDVLVHSGAPTASLPYGTSDILVCMDPLGAANWSLTPSLGIAQTSPNHDPIIVADINLDGAPDIVGAQVGNNGNWTTLIPLLRVGVLLGNGTGSFSLSLVLDLPSGNFLSTFGSIDFDADGDVDFFTFEGYALGMRLLRNQTRFGSGCGSPLYGVPALGATPSNSGNSAFQIRLGNARPFAPAVLALSLAANQNVGSCQVAVDLTPPNLILPYGPLGLAVTDASGTASVSLPIPPDPSLIGTTFFAQWGVADLQAPGGIALTQAGMIIIW